LEGEKGGGKTSGEGTNSKRGRVAGNGAITTKVGNFAEETKMIIDHLGGGRRRGAKNPIGGHAMGGRDQQQL